MDTLGDKIYKLRKQLGFSQEELGFRIGVTRQTISKWEMNTMQPSAENIIALCSIFNVSADTFLINKNKSSEIEVNEIAATENSAKTNKFSLSNNFISCDSSFVNISNLYELCCIYS